MARFSLIFLNLFILHSCMNLSLAVDEFIFDGFRKTGSTISLSGSAVIERNGILRLTQDASKTMGHAFYENPVQFKNSTSDKVSSFSTAFVFSVVPQTDKFGGHGLAFAICKSRDLSQALPSQYLGLMNASNAGNLSNHVFAVEFDTVQDFEFGDINDNHVGIDVNSLVSVASANASDVTIGKEALDLKIAEGIQAWIDYDSDEQKLNVSLSASSSKPALPILSYDVDLSPVLLENMYVGFSASTGLLASSHYISGWSFKMNGQTKPLDPSVLPSVPKQKSKKLLLALSASFSVVVVLILAIGTSLYVMIRVKNRDVIEPWELDVGPHRYSYSELKKATRAFRDEELLGFGGFGKVYKGTLHTSNIQVAVKRIDSRSKQGLREFISEIKTIGRLRHRNLVSLQGWCRQRNDLLLVYDFMPNGSLDNYIFNEPKLVLSWEQRFKILKGVASALLYLHEEWEQKVIHRDIKAGNVLLDCEMNGRLGDFGLAKLYEHGSNPSTTKVVGTLGYLAPELTRTGKATTSSDMFAYGALLLEVVCGRKPIEVTAMPEELILVDWVWDKWKKGCIFDVVDQRLKGEFDELEAVIVIKLGLMCSNPSPGKRPCIREVVRYLEGEMDLPEVTAMAPQQEEYDGKKDG